MRGRVVSVEPDSEDAGFFRELMARYGRDNSGPVADAAVRVVIAVRPEHFVAVDDGHEVRR